MRSLAGRELLRLVAFCVALAVPLSAGAESILVSAQESADGSVLQPPNAAAEGMEAALYDAGFIVFESESAGTGGNPSDLARTAREGGTDLILVLRVDYAAAQSGGATSTTGHAVWSLLDSATALELAEGAEDLSNQGREKTMDRPSLGQALGRTIAAKVAEAVAALPARQ